MTHDELITSLLSHNKGASDALARLVAAVGSDAPTASFKWSRAEALRPNLPDPLVNAVEAGFRYGLATFALPSLTLYITWAKRFHPSILAESLQVLRKHFYAECDVTLRFATERADKIINLAAAETAQQKSEA